MFKGIRFIIITNSKEEREELKRFIFSKTLAASMLGNQEGRQMVAISTGDVWLMTVVDETMVKKNHYQIFYSIEEFKTFIISSVLM